MRCACAIYRGISRVTRYNFFYRTVTKYRDTAQPYQEVGVGCSFKATCCPDSLITCDSEGIFIYRVMDAKISYTRLTLLKD